MLKIVQKLPISLSINDKDPNLKWPTQFYNLRISPQPHISLILYYFHVSPLCSGTTGYLTIPWTSGVFPFAILRMFIPIYLQSFFLHESLLKDPLPIKAFPDHPIANCIIPSYLMDTFTIPLPSLFFLQNPFINENTKYTTEPLHKCV